MSQKIHFEICLIKYRAIFLLLIGFLCKRPAAKQNPDDQQGKTVCFYAKKLFSVLLLIKPQPHIAQLFELQIIISPQVYFPAGQILKKLFA